MTAYLLHELPARASEYQISNWQTADGLPQNSALSIAQTDDGFLWVGTFNGLARFDGKDFTVFNRARFPQMPADEISRLCGGKDGRLWMLAGERITLLQHGTFREFKELPDMVATQCRMVEDATGKLCVVTQQDWMFRLSPDGTVERVALPKTGSHRQSVTIDNDGALWIGIGQSLHQYSHGDILPASQFDEEIRNLTTAPDGSLHVLLTDRRLIKGTDGTGETILRVPSPLSRVRIDAEGDPWAVGYHVFFWRNQKWQQIDFGDQFRQVGFTDTLIDREGSVWIGTDGYGLFRLRPMPVKVHSIDAGVTGRDAATVTEDTDGNIVVGHYRAGSSIRKDGAWTAWDLPEKKTIRSILQTTDGDYYCGMGTNGLWWRGEDREWIRRADCPISIVWALFEDKTGRLWIGGAEGIAIYSDDQFQELETSNGRITCFAETDDGVIWIGSRTGLYQVKGDQPSPLPGFNGANAASVHALFTDSAGRLWIGTVGGGLTRFWDGEFHTIDSRRGLHDDVVAQIIEDGLGFMWLGSNRGLFRVAIADLNRVLDSGKGSLHGRVFGKADGMLNPECAGGVQPNCLLDSEGHLWFCTVDGVIEVNPHTLPQNKTQPPIHIQSILVDGELLAPTDTPNNIIASGLPDRETSATRVTIPPGVRRIEIHYTGISLADLAGVRFRNRLVGLDHEWTDVGDRRVAAFSALPPGNYTFEVTAENSDGISNINPARLELMVTPQFTETIWFRFLVGGLVVLMVFGVQQYRLGRVRQVEELRQRIARDLHDEVGANIGAINLLSGMARADDAKSQSEAISEIQGVAQQTAQVLREVVWFVNPKFDSVADLSTHMETFLHRLFPVGKVDFQAELELPLTKLALSFRRSFYAIYKEALHNIAKHAAAKRVTVKLVVLRHTVELEVTDDGKGFDSDVSSDGNGLSNMRARATEIGGRIKFETRPEQGTRLRLSAPL